MQTATSRPARPGTEGDGTATRRRSTPVPATPEDPGVTRARRVWTAGAYDRIAAGFRHEAEAFVARLGVAPGTYVLDAACGSGNLTIPLARGGARVFGLDIARNLLHEAQAWAARERVGVMLDEGTVEEMPYADGAFPLVVSMFGAMFAARPALVASELARVTRRGGRVAMANWVMGGFIGRMLALHVAYAPPPAGAPSTLLWGDEAALRERFPAEHWDLTLTPRVLTFRFPHSPAGTAELFRASYGPTVRTLEAITEDQRAEFGQRLRELWESAHRAGASGTEVDSEYLEVVATRR